MISDAKPAREYLKKRLQTLNVNKQKLEIRANSLKYEMDEIENKMKDISGGLDSTYEVFSPMPKDGAFDKKETGSLQLRRNELQMLMKKNLYERDAVEKDIAEIKNALGQEMPCESFSELLTGSLRETARELDGDVSRDVALETEGAEESFKESFKESSDESFDTEKADKNTGSMGCMKCMEYISGYEILERRENERRGIAYELREKAEISLENLLRKCTLCSGMLERDVTRAKVELEIMSKIIKEMTDSVRNIIDYLQPVEAEAESIVFEKALKMLLNKIGTDTNMQVRFEMGGYVANIPLIVETTVLKTIAEAVKSIAGFEMSETLAEKENKEVSGFLKCDIDSIYIVIENKTEEEFDIENAEEMTDIYDGRDDMGLLMIKENVCLLGGETKIHILSDKKMRIEIMIPLPNESNTP